MAKKFYLVDTENVGSVWVDLIPTMAKQDCLLLFYTVNSSGISYEDLLKLAGQEQKYQMIPCFTGRNGLDFQLVSYLGYLIKSNARAEYIIISNDIGYDAVVRFWSEKEISVTRVKASVLQRSLQQNVDTEEVSQKTRQKTNRKTAAKQADSVEETKDSNASVAESMEEPEAETETRSQKKSSGRAKSRKQSVTEENNDTEPAAETKSQSDSETEPQKASVPAKKGRTRTTAKRNSKKETPDVDFSIWLPEETKGEASKMIEVFQQENRDEVHKIYLCFVKRFGQEKGVAFYRSLKPHLNEIYDRL
ncbi:MAG: hypothetical protein K2J67_07635 [Lachnospiraceae bacterium]|nr:hypothetical protein [Lachnospiraceae bacterium]